MIREREREIERETERETDRQRERERQRETERETETERDRGRERERQKHQCARETLIGCLLYVPICGHPHHNLGMCPDWTLKLQPFGVWDDAPIN